MKEEKKIGEKKTNAHFKRENQFDLNISHLRRVKGIW